MIRCAWIVVFFGILLAPVSASSATLTSGTIKLFILAGQSNMEGQGYIAADGKRNGGRGSLEYLVKDTASTSAARYAHLVDASGKWRVRNDV